MSRMVHSRSVEKAQRTACILNEPRNEPRVPSLLLDVQAVRRSALLGQATTAQTRARQNHVRSEAS